MYMKPDTTENKNEYAYRARQYSPLDRVIKGVDQALQTIFGNPPGTGRENPAVSAKPHSQAQSKSDETGKQSLETETSDLKPGELNDQQRKHNAALMRINHCGEVCAQALYQGQALTARSPHIRESMQHASDEENDHLRWCRSRLEQLDSRVSYLNPIWYLGSFGIGAMAGLAGDKWSLGFVAETERQVVNHLDSHLQDLHTDDYKSLAVLTQMKIDEAEHATNAVNNGAAELPEAIKKLMGLSSKIMTRTAYWI